jgi:AraC-like DNA-binding protein
MKPFDPDLIISETLVEPRSGFSPFFSENLPVGLTLICLKGSAGQPDITVPPFEEEGLVLTLLHGKQDIRIALGHGKEYLQETSPGLGLLSAANKPLHFKFVEPAGLAAVILFIGRNWIGNFMKDNGHFQKIEQILEEKEDRILTCRLGRRQLSQLTAIVAGDRTGKERYQLEMQNNALSLLEYFLCHRHRNPLGASPAASIGNDDDLSLIKEVESYISEYYCSDTFTVDSILKKTYTSYHKLNFLFKSIHGMTISEYIRNKRIERSKEMIADNAKSISQIDYEIGYSSISNYILAFKKIYQITPGKYKKQMDSLA